MFKGHTLEHHVSHYYGLQLNFANLRFGPLFTVSAKIRLFVYYAFARAKDLVKAPNIPLAHVAVAQSLRRLMRNDRKACFSSYKVSVRQSHLSQKTEVWQ